MLIGKQLGKIESQLHAFALTEDVEHLIAARILISELISDIRHTEIKMSTDKLNKLIEQAFGGSR